METNMIIESLKFLVLGMGVVYLFLTIMIYVLKIQAKVIAKLYPIIDVNKHTNNKGRKQ